MGAWDAIRDGLGSVLAFFYSIVPNSGFAIIMLTVVVRLALFPLTAKQAKSMIAMQRVQPEIKKLQAKYKNDRQKLNEEMMKFYKENQINPLGGCLPLLLQMPVFIALFQTLQKIQNFIPADSKMYAALCGKATGCAAPGEPHMTFLGLDLTKSASKAADAGIGEAAPYLVLVALVVVTGYFQQRQTMRNQTTPNPQMAIISKVFPVVFGFISWTIPSGVVLYFFTSNLWQIGQQEVVLRTIGSAAGPPPKKARALAEGLEDGSGAAGTTKTAAVDEEVPGKKSGGSTRSARAGSAPAKKAPTQKPPTQKPSGKSTGKSTGTKSEKTTEKSTGKAGEKPAEKPASPGQSRSPGGARSNRKRKR